MMVECRDFVVRLLRISQTFLSCLHVQLDFVSLSEIKDQTAKSADRDQTACMCWLI